MSTSKTLAEAIKEARAKTSLTQVAAAKKAGLNSNTYAKIERGDTKKPDALSLRKIGKALGVDPNKFLDLLN